jgi:hypothetical protein
MIVTEKNREGVRKIENLIKRLIERNINVSDFLFEHCT